MKIKGNLWGVFPESEVQQAQRMPCRCPIDGHLQGMNELIGGKNCSSQMVCNAKAIACMPSAKRLRG
jgi:hypothetical protein